MAISCTEREKLFLKNVKGIYRGPRTSKKNNHVSEARRARNPDRRTKNQVKSLKQAVEETQEEISHLRQKLKGDKTKEDSTNLATETEGRLEFYNELAGTMTTLKKEAEKKKSPALACPAPLAALAPLGASEWPALATPTSSTLQGGVNLARFRVKDPVESLLDDVVSWILDVAR